MRTARPTLARCLAQLVHTLPRSARTRPGADWPFRSVRVEDLEGLPAEDMLVIERHMQWVIAQRRRS